MAFETMVDPPEIEYLDGRAYPKVSPKLRHSLVQGAMVRILHRTGGGRGCVAPELDVYPGGGTATKFVPDIAYITTERLKALSPAQRDDPPFSPDIAVEVWSPSNDRSYLETKIARYLATGSLLVLDVNPNARTVSAHDASSVRTYESGEMFEHPAIPWLRFEVAETFADLDAIEE